MLLLLLPHSASARQFASAACPPVTDTTLLLSLRRTGALIAAATDLSFNPRGYAAVLCNDLLTSLYLIMVKNTPGTNGLRCSDCRCCF